jgi:uncharacterized protein YaiE (UPF0345 family)
MRTMIMGVVTVGIVIAGCGESDSDDTSAPNSEVSTPAADDDAGVAGEEEGAGVDPEDPSVVSSIEVPPIPETGEGSCSVTVSGDKQAEWTGGGTLGDAGISYWYGDAERELIGDGFSILLNCQGDGDSLSFVSGSAADETTVPMAPGSYSLTSAGAQSGVDPIGVLVVLADSATNWRVTDPGGTLTITRFDDAGIAGTFEFPMEDSLAEMSGDPSEGTIVVSGEFDFVNPNA